MKIRPFDFIKKINQPVINTGDVRLSTKTKKDAFLQKATEKSSEMLGKLSVDKKTVTEEAAKFFLKIPYVGPALKEATDATTAPSEAKTTDLEEALKIKEALAQKRTQNAEGDKFQNFELNLDKQYISTDKKDAAFKAFVKNLKKELDTESNFIALKTIEFLNKHDVTLEVYPQNATTAQIVQINKEQNEKLSIDILKGKNLDDAYLCFMYRAALDNPDEIEKKILMDFITKSFSKEEIKDLELVFNAKEWINLDKDILAGKLIAYHLNDSKKSDTEVDLNDPKVQKLLTNLLPDTEAFHSNMKSINESSSDNKELELLTEIKSYQKKLEDMPLEIYYKNAAKEILPMLAGARNDRSTSDGVDPRTNNEIRKETNPKKFNWRHLFNGPTTKDNLIKLVYLISLQNKNKLVLDTKIWHLKELTPIETIKENIDQCIRNVSPIE